MFQSITSDILSTQIIVTLEEGHPVFIGCGWAGCNNGNPMQVKVSVLIDGMPSPKLSQ